MGLNVETSNCQKFCPFPSSLHLVLHPAGSTCFGTAGVQPEVSRTNEQHLVRR